MSPRQLVPCGLLTLAWGLFWWPVIRGDSQLVARDLGFFATPAKRYLLERFSAGELPLWTPATSAGMPFLADPSNGVFYPLNLPFLLAPTVPHGLSWFVILHSLLGMWGLYALARALGTGRTAAVWAGLVYGLAGYTVSIGDNITYLSAVAWAPLGLACTVRGLATGRHRYTGLAALCLAQMLLVGDSLDGAVTLAAMAALGLARAATREAPPAVPPSRRRVFALVHVVGVAALGTAIAAVQVLPTLELLAASARRDGLPYEMMTAWSFPPARLLEVVQPYLFGANFPAFEFLGRRLYGDQTEPWAASVYVGLVPVLLAAAAVAARPARAAPWLGLAAVALVLSFGRHLPGFEVLAGNLPFAGTQRYPEKLLFWVTLGVAALAALGADAVLVRARLPGRGTPRLGVVPRAGLCLAIALVPYFFLLEWPARALVPELARETTWFWAARGLAGVSHYQALLLHLGVIVLPLAALPWIPPRGRAAAVSALLALAVADLAWVHRGLYLQAPTGLVADGAEPRALARIREAGGAGPVRVFFDERAPGYRVYTFANAVTPAILAHFPDEDAAMRRGYRHLYLYRNLRERLAPNTGVRHGVGYLNGAVSPLRPAAHARHLDRGLATDPRRVMVESGVEYVITSVEPHNPVWDRAGFREVAVDPDWNLRVLAVEGPRPPRRIVPAPGADPAGGSGRVVERRPRPEHRVFDVDSPHERARLVLTESWFAGWRAVVDGAPAPVLRFDDRFMAVEIPRGRHSVELTYHASGLATGLWISAAGLLVAVLLLVPRPVRGRSRRWLTPRR